MAEEEEQKEKEWKATCKLMKLRNDMIGRQRLPDSTQETARLSAIKTTMIAEHKVFELKANALRRAYLRRRWRAGFNYGFKVRLLEKFGVY